MTLASSAGQLTGQYRGSAAGFDAMNARLIDFSGNGLHLPLLGGTPAFAAYSGVTAMTMRGDTYFGCPLMDTVPVVPTAPRSTWIAAIWSNMTNSEVYDFIIATLRDYALSDHAWITPSTTFENSSGIASSPRMRIRADGYAFGGSLNFAVYAPIPASAWNIVQVTQDPDNLQYRVRVGTGAWQVTAIGSLNLTIPSADDFRLGYRTTPITTTGGYDFAMAQTLFYAGDPANENPAAYNALIAALITDPTS